MERSHRRWIQSKLNRIRAAAMLMRMVYASRRFSPVNFEDKAERMLSEHLRRNRHTVCRRGCSRSTAQRKWIRSRPILIHVKSTWTASKQDAFETGQRTCILQTGPSAQDGILTKRRGVWAAETGGKRRKPYKSSISGKLDTQDKHTY